MAETLDPTTPTPPHPPQGPETFGHKVPVYPRLQWYGEGPGPPTQSGLGPELNPESGTQPLRFTVGERTSGSENPRPTKPVSETELP